MTMVEAEAVIRPSGRRSFRERHPVLNLLITRVPQGLLTMLIVATIVFWATQVLPGDAAYSVLGQSATPERVQELQAQLGLDKPLIQQYLQWLHGLLTGNPGNSLANGSPVTTLLGDGIRNSAVLVLAAGVIGTALAFSVGLLAALRRDKLFDHTVSTVALVLASLPEFVIGVILVIGLASVFLHLLPAVSFLAPGVSPWELPNQLVLPVTTLVLVIFPYIFRMTRGSVIETLESDYVEMAHLKGAAPTRALLSHAVPNALAPIIQVVGLTLIYLAGGIVVVEYVFNYPGLGRELVDAIANRDIPVIQFIVLILTAFYIVANILTDALTLAVSPRRRNPRSS